MITLECMVLVGRRGRDDSRAAHHSISMTRFKYQFPLLESKSA
jgi:hypothetical protein